METRDIPYIRRQRGAFDGADEQTNVQWLQTRRSQLRKQPKSFPKLVEKWATEHANEFADADFDDFARKHAFSIDEIARIRDAVEPYRLDAFNRWLAAASLAEMNAFLPFVQDRTSFGQLMKARILEASNARQRNLETVVDDTLSKTVIALDVLSSAVAAAEQNTSDADAFNNAHLLAERIRINYESVFAQHISLNELHTFYLRRLADIAERLLGFSGAQILCKIHSR